MKYSDITKLKHLAQDKISRTANPAVVRNSTIFFKSMQELLKQEKLVTKGSKVNFHEYGRAGSQTTIALQNFIAELEQAHSTFLTPTGFGAVALAIISICRPGDEIVVTDAVYAPTRMITSKLLKEFNVKTHNKDMSGLDMNPLRGVAPPPIHAEVRLGLLGFTCADWQHF